MNNESSYARNLVTNRVFIVAGELSGDTLGAALMAQLQQTSQQPFDFHGVGGPAMQAMGLRSLFPLSDIAVMGVLPVVRRLPLLLRRIAQTVAAVIAVQPRALILVDSPDFTHRVAQRVRKYLPDLIIFDYVSPSVWAWRPGRAAKMRGYIDEVLALLPFEPAAYRRLSGPDCQYVGHPLLEHTGLLCDERTVEYKNRPTILVLPGSRRSEIERLMPIFGQVVADVGESSEIILPAVSHHYDRIVALSQRWPRKPQIISSQEREKYQAFRIADAALAVSGTVTLELALAGVPSVVAYRLSAIEAFIARRMIQVPTIVLPNLILGENIYPEFIQEHCRVDTLKLALLPLLSASEERRRQIAGLKRLRQAMTLPDHLSPAQAAAKAILIRAYREHYKSKFFKER